MTRSPKFTAEALGTMFLLTAVVGSGIMGERLSGGNVAIALLANAVATGAALVAIILAFGGISGAHLNPAVTLAVAMERGIPWSEVPAYIFAQAVGAFAGVAAAHVMFELPVFSLSQHVAIGRSATLQRVHCHVRFAHCHMGLQPNAAGSCSFRCWSVHHGRVLVYSIDVICKSGGNAGALFYEYIFRDPLGGCARFYRRPADRRIGSHRCLVMVVGKEIESWAIRSASSFCVPGTRLEARWPKDCFAQKPVIGLKSSAPGRIRRACILAVSMQ